MTAILPYIQIILAVVLTVLVLIQQSEASLGAAFGGGDLNNQSRTRRGAEAFVFNTTIVVAVLFVLSAIANIIL